MSAKKLKIKFLISLLNVLVSGAKLTNYNVVVRQATVLPKYIKL